MDEPGSAELKEKFQRRLDQITSRLAAALKDLPAQADEKCAVERRRIHRALSSIEKYWNTPVNPSWRNLVDYECSAAEAAITALERRIKELVANSG